MKPGEQGAALISVLILVGVVGALAAGLFDRLRLATRLAANAEGQARARAVAASAEALLLARLETRSGPMPELDLPVPGASARARLRDGANCVNLNAVVSGSEGAFTASAPGMRQLAGLLGAVGVPATEAERVAAATADWIDSDNNPLPNGAEDAVYARAATPYRTAGTLLAEPSEWRAVAGVSADLYARLRPHVCALPVAEPAPVNVDTLTRAQAPVLAALIGGSSATAQTLLAERPPGGWRDIAAFWNSRTLQATPPSGDTLRQAGTLTRWYTVDITVRTPDGAFAESALIDAREARPRLAVRRWTVEE